MDRFLTPFGANMRPSWANLRPTWGQLEVNLRATWHQLEATWGQLEATRSHSGLKARKRVRSYYSNVFLLFGSSESIKFWSILGAEFDKISISLVILGRVGSKLPYWGQLEPTWGQLEANLSQHGAKLGPNMGPSWHQKLKKERSKMESKKWSSKSHATIPGNPPPPLYVNEILYTVYCILAQDQTPRQQASGRMIDGKSNLTRIRASAVADIYIYI